MNKVSTLVKRLKIVKYFINVVNILLHEMCSIVYNVLCLFLEDINVNSGEMAEEVPKAAELFLVGKKYTKDVDRLKCNRSDHN